MAAPSRTPEPVSTPHAPAAIGPYSQAVRVGTFVFVSGQIPIEPQTGALVGTGIADETRQVLANVDAVLQAAGSSLAQVVKTTVYLTDLDDFSAMNEAYAAVFGQTRPARATVQVARLPRGAHIEIDAVAVV